jgi:hypothetical protein
VDGENLLTDPSRGLYSRDYFGERRYENAFASSYGHSVPRIAGKLQAAGAEFRDELLDVETSGPVKSAQLELPHAHPVAGLERVRRELLLHAGGTVWLRGMFRFAGRVGADPRPAPQPAADDRAAGGRRLRGSCRRRGSTNLPGHHISFLK